MSSLMAISPVDGRYAVQTSALSAYFSEWALFRYRIIVEIEYFIALSEIPLKGLENFNNPTALRNIAVCFSEADAERIKEIEKTTRHDVKAVEYFLREKFDELSLSEYKEYIHFSLTSQDINNTSMPMMMRDAWNNELLPALTRFHDQLVSLASDWENVTLLARTHGQPASPTRLGKELRVFVERIDNQLSLLCSIPFAGKFGGATGNFNAHHVAFPEINWRDFANHFLTDRLGISRLQTTTQIEHYDYAAAFFDGLCRINTILIDFSRDIWMYIMLECFTQKVNPNEVGSSAMPHKVNPIDFENAEGNLGIANALLTHFSQKLPISRLQRDLTDSTVTRNIGVPYAHVMIALSSLIRGLGKLELNLAKIERDLQDNWAVVAEGIQTILRRENYPDPYNALKHFSRGKKHLTQADFAVFIDSLKITDELKNELRQITPFNYFGEI